MVIEDQLIAGDGGGEGIVLGQRGIEGARGALDSLANGGMSDGINGYALKGPVESLQGLCEGI